MSPRPPRTSSSRRPALLAALLAALVALGLVPAAQAGGGTHHRSAVLEDLDAATIPLIQAEMRLGRLSSVELTRAYLQRIRDLDDRLNAVLAVNPHALDEADASDRERRRNGPRSPLEGVPVLLKDNIDTEAQGATAGSRALLGSRPDDATIVRRLHEAGAVVIGKANLSEWANFRSFNSTSGWSAVGGLTANPYVLDRNACGSSSGSAVGVAASLAQVAIGTETDGSIVCPAGATGIVGMKPTLGLVSRDGIVPISAAQDTAGPMARHTVDAALTLQVIDGRDHRNDRATADIPADMDRRFRPALDAEALDGARIGVWLRGASGSAEADAVTEEAVAAVEAAGGTVVEVDLPYQDVIGENEFAALLSEFERDIERYLRNTPGRHPDTLEGLIRFNERDPVELEYFGQEIFHEAVAAPDAGSPEHVAARTAARQAARASIDETLATYDLDAIMAPTNSPAWVSTLGEGDAFLFGSSGPAAVAGYPNISVPAGYSGELPVGMSFFGPRWSDARMLSLAYSFEQHTDVRRAPQLLPTIGD
jgi:amidase